MKNYTEIEESEFWDALNAEIPPLVFISQRATDGPVLQKYLTIFDNTNEAIVCCTEDDNTRSQITNTIDLADCIDYIFAEGKFFRRNPNKKYQS